MRAQVVRDTRRRTLHDFIVRHVRPGATVYTDEAKAYRRIPFAHETVNHDASEYVRGDAHTNGIESFWAGFKRAHKGAFHKLSPKHLDRFVAEFCARQNMRDADTADQLATVVRGMEGKRLTYEELITPNGLDSGAYGAR